MATGVDSKGQRASDHAHDAVYEEQAAVGRNGQCARAGQNEQQAGRQGECAEHDQAQLGGVLPVERDDHGGNDRDQGAPDEHGPVTGSDV